MAVQRICMQTEVEEADEK